MLPKNGCDYFVSDFKTINKETIINVLSTGNVSIVAALIFKMNKEGKKYCMPYLYLRTRNTNRGIVDLFSMKTTCSMLTETGCSYSKEDRPGGGLNLIPKKTGLCEPYKNPIEELKKWEPYQGLLGKIVKRYTDHGVNEKLKQDVEDTFYMILTKQFDGIADEEIKDILGGIAELTECFPSQYQNALNKAKHYKIFLNKPIKK